uniref:Uncharacterized protein n=1 Tax=Octopus bimaculoides TaxID=37653 RepID=A0A0L8FJF0_OCTBM
MDNLSLIVQGCKMKIKLEKYIVLLLEKTKHYKAIMWGKLTNQMEQNAILSGKLKKKKFKKKKKKKSPIRITLILHQHNTDFSMFV